LTTAYRLGMYGGAFDPPHLAHMALAQAAVEQFELDELRIVPTGQAWHKTRVFSAAQHRVAMARLAFADLPQARVDERETKQLGISYTVNTLQALHAEHPQAQLFLLMGQDQLAFFTQWHRHAEILEIATLLVASRAHSVWAGDQNDSEKAVKIKHQTICMPPSAISATQIRHQAELGKPLDEMVKPSVARYIEAHRLYTAS
jgi:nicotinate-nucleotide adenylyltransferase